MPKRVTRSSVVGVERRAAALRDSAVVGRHFTGHAAVFDQRTAIGNPLSYGFYETVNRAAFNKSLSDGSDVVMLADHDPGKPLARTSAGTLTVQVDSGGLATDAPDLVRTSYADDLIANLQAKNVAGMSFGFQVVRDNWTSETVETNDGMTVDVDVRELLEVRLIEVSTTAFPAYKGTDADVRCALRSRASRGFLPVIPPASLAALGHELRAGATLSAATLATLQQVLDYLSTADDAVDAAQPLLATLMGVPNPDADDADDGGDGRSSQPAQTTGNRNGTQGQPAPTTGDALELIRRQHRFNARRLGLTA